MALPAPGNPISASMINTEANRSSSFTAPLSGNNSTPQVGSLVKIYSPPDSSVNQIAPHKFSEFYSKSWSGRNSIQFKQYYYNSSNTFPNATQACVSSAWYGGSGTTVYYTGVLGVGTLLYIGRNSFVGYPFTIGRNYSFKTAPNSTQTITITANNSGVVQSYSVCSSLTSFWTAAVPGGGGASPGSFSSASAACDQRSTYSYNYIAYHTGVNVQPIAGDYVYFDQTLTTPLMAVNGKTWYQGSKSTGGAYGEVTSRYAFNMETGSGSSNLNGPGAVKANITDCSRQTIFLKISGSVPAITKQFYYQASIGDAVNLTINDVLYTDSDLTATYATAQTWLFDAGTSVRNPCYNTISCPSSINLNSSGVITAKTCNINPCS